MSSGAAEARLGLRVALIEKHLASCQNRTFSSFGKDRLPFGRGGFGGSGFEAKQSRILLAPLLKGDAPIVQPLFKRFDELSKHRRVKDSV